MRTSLFAIAVGAGILVASIYLPNPAFAERVCTKECTDGVCRTRCIEKYPDRDHAIIEHREKRRDHDDHDVEIKAPGVGVEIGH